MNIPGKPKLQQMTCNHLSDIVFMGFILNSVESVNER